MMKQFCSVLIFLLLCSNSNGQQANNYSIYKKQSASLLKERAVSDNEITDFLKKYASNNINSDSALTKLLVQLCSGRKDIGILFYFFNNDPIAPGSFRY